MRFIANLAMMAGVLVLAGLLWLEVDSAQRACQTAMEHFQVRRCDEHLATFCWPVVGIVAVASMAWRYNASGGRKAYLLLAATAFLILAAVSAFGALMLVEAAAWGQAALA